MKQTFFALAIVATLSFSLSLSANEGHGGAYADCGGCGSGYHEGHSSCCSCPRAPTYGYAASLWDGYCQTRTQQFDCGSGCGLFSGLFGGLGGGCGGYSGDCGYGCFGWPGAHGCGNACGSGGCGLGLFSRLGSHRCGGGCGLFSRLHSGYGGGACFGWPGAHGCCGSQGLGLGLHCRHGISVFGFHRGGYGGCDTGISHGNYDFGLSAGCGCDSAHGHGNYNGGHVHGSNGVAQPAPTPVQEVAPAEATPEAASEEDN